MNSSSLNVLRSLASAITDSWKLINVVSMSSGRAAAVSLQNIRARGSQAIKSAVAIEQKPQPNPNPKQLPQRTANGEEKPVQFKVPKYPIVLCHGLFGYDYLGVSATPLLQKHYFYGVKEALESYGCTVYVSKVPATSSIEERARELKRFLVEHNGEKDVNLVAHSMGGLDARFLASHLSKGVNVRSITTISTPHRGSPVADFFMDTFGIGAKGLVMEELGRESTKEGANASRDDSLKRLLDLLVRMVDAPAYGNLTSKYLTQTFNPSTPDNANVLYYSYGGFVQRPSSLSWLRVPWEIVYQKEGDNDGVVSIYSSRWGKFIRSVEGDHFFLKRHIPPTLEEAAGTPSKADNSTQADSHVQTVLKLLKAIRASSNIVASSSSSSQPQQQFYKEIVDARLKRIGPASAAKEGHYYGLDQEYDDTDDLRKTCLYMDIMNRLAEDGL
ncbi:hypothetical protein MP638_007011 [Amoeboaphelidium occidentale]|nr:hypothetical protein MP638_007011 [Amoeboaphelidium occidentale]